MAAPSQAANRVLPTGTVTFLFSDIEGSTHLVQSLGPAYRPLLERHQALLRAAFEEAGGVEVGTEGDSFFVAFPSAPAAVAAAAAAQRALSGEAWPTTSGPVRVRMGLHSGEATLGGDSYVGLDVHRAARIAAAAHGGQVLLSETTRALAAPSLPGDLALLDLGEHRLKDLDQPVRLTQLVVTGLAQEFPPPRTLEIPTNLPPQMTEFIGRTREAEVVADLVRRSRLLTLSGPGGTGKTRLALQVAGQLRGEFGGGVFFVDLSPLTDPDLIPTTIAVALGVREQPDRPLLASLQAHLRDRRLLLVLDNFEQVQAGAALVPKLLEAAPELVILVTSREVLHVRGEQEYPVPPLAVPDLAALPAPDALARYDAVALFIRRAQAVRPDFAVDTTNAPAVAGICARLDGLPLAIELAAARVKMLEPGAILRRLDQSLSLLTSSSYDLTERQRTLRGAIGWSYDLLDPTERILFRRLGVFVGGCSIEQAQVICDPDGRLGIDMLDGLSSLVDKSLLRRVDGTPGEPRVGMLQTVREYALERLTQSPDWDVVRHAHEDLFSTMALQSSTEMMGAHQKEWADRLQGERHNLRAAIQRLADDDEVERALDAAAALWRFWQQRGDLAEGRSTLEELLARPDADAPTLSRARALAALGGLLYWQSDMTAAERAYVEGLAVQRMHDDPAGLAEALYNLGFVWAVAERHQEARALYEEALSIANRIGDRAFTLRLQESLAFLMFHMGEFAAARQQQEANVAAFRDDHQMFRVATGSGFLSYLEAMEGEVAAARARQREAFRIFEEAGDSHWMVRVLLIAAATAVLAGDLELAARLSGAYGRLAEPLGEIATPVTTLGLPDPAAQARSGLGDAAFERAYSAGRALRPGEVAALLE
jgi:predicted ATPase/class 3 adenylate cyclase